MSKYDHIVIGAGIVGSCAALELARRGRNVLLLEQFSLPHTRGSSHGATRLIRSCYAEPYFASMMPDAFRLWKNIEESSGTTVIVQTGALCVAEAKSQTWQDALEHMKRNNPEHITLLTTDELAEKYPMITYSHNYSVFLDKTGGIILANKALSTVQDLYKRHGGQLWDGCRVLKIEPGDDVKVSTSNGFVTASSLIICAGSWTRKLLSPDLMQTAIPLQPTAVRVFYWKEKEFGKYTVDVGFPAFIDCTSESKSIYGLPSLEYPSLVKVCVHGGVSCDPDERDKAVPDESLKLDAEEYIKEHLPGLEATPSVVEHCMYTVTPDDSFVIDRLPGHKNIVVGSGFCVAHFVCELEPSFTGHLQIGIFYCPWEMNPLASCHNILVFETGCQNCVIKNGTGFKFAPLVGKLLGELATGQTPSHDLTHFLLSRFGHKVKGQP